MQPQSIADLKSAVPQILEEAPYIDVLILFGSRARGSDTEASDWDFAVLYNEEMRKQYQKGSWAWLRLWTILERVLDLPEDKIDLVDLRTCSDVLAHCIAQDGKVIYEKNVGEFERFQKKALKSESELKAYRQSVREKVYAALQRWKG